jgi:phenylacetate-CoA ligase
VTTTGAETVLPHQRRAIEEAFETEVADQYGACEHCGNISECEEHRYHVDMEFGIIEFVPAADLPSGSHRIICTALHNPVMPLIRYDIGDLASVSDTPCPCGRKSTVVSRIDGRIEAYIVTPDGRRLGRLDFLFKDTANIVEAQLVQATPDTVTAKIVRGRNYSARDEADLLASMRRYLGDEIAIEFEYLAEIPRGRNGKFRQIVSRSTADAPSGQGVPPERGKSAAAPGAACT